MLSTTAKHYLVRRFDLLDERAIHSDGDEIHCHGMMPGGSTMGEFFAGFESDIERDAMARYHILLNPSEDVVLLKDKKATSEHPSKGQSKV